jgi:hypothetical protein
MVQPTDLPGVRREKRNFSRVDENVFMEFFVVRSRSGAANKLKRTKPRERNDRLRQLDELNGHIRSLLAQVRAMDIHTARCLAAINKKLDLLANAVSRKREDRAMRFTRRVNLSAGGVGFRSSLALDAGARLAIRLAAPDYDLKVSAYGDVVYCDRDSSDAELPYRIGVRFPSLKMSDRQMLFSHVLSRYVERIRSVKNVPDKA